MQQSGKISVLTCFTALILGQINQDLCQQWKKNGRFRWGGFFSVWLLLLLGLASQPGTFAPDLEASAGGEMSSLAADTLRPGLPQRWLGRRGAGRPLRVSAVE